MNYMKELKVLIETGQATSLEFLMQHFEVSRATMKRWIGQLREAEDLDIRYVKFEHRFKIF